jgi:quinol monooxygenase YgiN
MIHIVWEFRIRSKKRSEFEAHYSATGTWVKLFRKSGDYIRTILMPDLQTRNRYLLIDSWRSLKAFEEFKKKYRTEYETLDQQCEQFTVEEQLIGYFSD